MAIVDLDPGDPRLDHEVLAVLRELRPHLDTELFAAIYREGHPQGLRFTAAYVDDVCVGVAGWRITANTSAIRHLYIDDLVTTATNRSKGVGRSLLGELWGRALAAGCHTIELDSGVQRGDAHRFYMREGLTIAAFHFSQNLGPV